MAKGIDIVKVKEEVEKGNLRAYVVRNIFGDKYICLEDTQSEEVVCIGKDEVARIGKDEQ